MERPLREGGDRMERSPREDGDRVESLLSDDAALSDGDPKPECWTACSCFLCGTRCRAAICLAVAVATVLAVALLAALVVVPKAVDGLIGAATLTVVNGSLGPASMAGIEVAVTVRLDNAGPFRATLLGFNASVFGPPSADAAAELIGHMLFPDVLVSPSSATTLGVRSLLHVASARAFRLATMPILRGEGAAWEVRGEAVVSVLGMRVGVALSKALRMPPAQIESMRSFNVDIERGNGSSGVLSVTADATFFSSSPLELLSLGDVSVDLFYDLGANQPARPPEERRRRASALGASSVRMGTVRLPAFELRRGLNRQRMAIQLDTSLGEEAQVAIGAFIGRWISGAPQTILTVGPVGYPAAYLDGVSLIACEVEPLPTSLFTAALMSADHTVHGWDVASGRPCGSFRQSQSECLKGALVYARSPGRKPLLLRDVVFDAFFDAPIAYRASIRLHAGSLPVSFKSFECAASDKFTRLRSAPGIWAFAPAHNRSYSPDAAAAFRQRLADAAIPLEGQPVESAFFLAAEPQPGQANETAGRGAQPCILGDKQLDPFDCCFTTRFTAAACYYRARGQQVVPISARGRATLTIDDWTLRSHHFHASFPRVPTGFTDALTDFRVGLPGPVGEELYLGLTCQDIEFRSPHA